MPADTPPPTANAASNGSNGSHTTTTPTTPTSPTVTSTTPSNNTVSAAAAPPNNTRKRTPDEYTKNFDLNEISPLRTPSSSSSVASNGSRSANNDKSELNAQRNNGIKSTATTVLLPPVVLNMSRAPASSGSDATDAANDSETCATDGTHLAGGRRNKFRGTYDDIVGRLDLSERARLPFVVVCALCVLLLAALIVMAIVWPRVPAYQRAPVCVEKECLAAGAQILLWSNISVTDAVCQQPYEWACGRFDEDYAGHPLNGRVGGEWTAASSAEYEELLQIHSFVAQLPTSVSSSAQLMLKRLHSDCMKYDSVDKAQADFTLAKAIRSLSEWVYGKDWVPNAWDFQTAMIIAHSRYGLSPFFKVSMRQRNSLPFGNIITVSEGSLGLPHRMFYNLKHDHRLIEAYKMLMRDFAINFGTVAEVANKFAEEMFHFEKRIVNALPAERKSVIVTLGEVKKLAPMLPVLGTITTTFSSTRLDDKTPIWIEDVNMLREMSIIVSTTDVTPLNSFLVWSLARHFMPFMSADYRAALRNFDSVLYGHKSQPPAWYQCTKLLHDWVPFAVDALRFNPELVVTQQSSASLFDHSHDSAGGGDQHLHSEPLVRDRTDYDRELVRLLFAHLRHQMQRAVDDNVAIDTDVTAYINDKLGTLQLHVGLPADVVETTAYVNAYYADFLWRKLNFIEHLESRWSFAKRKMEDQLVPTKPSDRIVSNLYPAFGAEQRRELVQYSSDLHAIVVAEQAVHRPYFHHKYPLPVNFARIGTQIAGSLLQAVDALGDQFERRKHERNNGTVHPFRLGDYACLDASINAPGQPPVDQSVHLRHRLDVTAATFTSRAYAEFERMLAANRPVPDAGLSELLTYDRLGLRDGQRQAGLRRLDDAQLFALTMLQSHCGRSETVGYQRYKPFVEGRLAEREIFQQTWSQVPLLSRFMHCPANTAKCESVL